MKKLNTKEWIAVVMGICVVGLFFTFGSNLVSFFNHGTFTTQTKIFPQAPQLGIKDVLAGTSTPATLGNLVTVDYVGRLSDGTIFDSSVARKEPVQFVLGAGKVIEGFEKGVTGMRLGGVRILTIPPEMGYGSTTYGPIPGGSTLTFEVHLLKIEK